MVDVKIDKENNDQKVSMATTVKGWIVIGAATLSLGFSFGLWANSNNTTVNNTAKEVIVIQEVIKKMPAPEKIVNKDVLDVQMEGIKSSLVRIENNQLLLSKQLNEHQQDSVRLLSKK